MIDRKKLTLNNKPFALELTWMTVRNKNAVTYQSKMLRQPYGSYLKGKGIVGFTTKPYQNAYGLAAVVAFKFKSGIFITDKIAQNPKEETHYWVCFFDNKVPLEQIHIGEGDDMITTSGDAILTESQVREILGAYAKAHNLKVTADIEDNIAHKLGFEVKKHIALDSLAKGRVGGRFKVEKLQNHNNIILGGLGAVGIAIALAYFFYPSETPAPTKTAVKAIKPESTALYKVTKKINQSNLYSVLTRIEIVLSLLPISENGWGIKTINYTQTMPNTLVVVYDIQEGGSVQSGMKFTKYLKLQDEGMTAGIKFFKNDQSMQIAIQLPKLAATDLSQKKVKKLFDNTNNIALISSIQRSKLNYSLGKIAPLSKDITRQGVSLSTMRPIQFKQLILIASSKPLFVANTVVGSYDNNFKINWQIRGDLYA